jgi:hypothetical protein
MAEAALTITDGTSVHAHPLLRWVMASYESALIANKTYQQVFQSYSFKTQIPFHRDVLYEVGGHKAWGTRIEEVDAASGGRLECDAYAPPKWIIMNLPRAFHAIFRNRRRLLASCDTAACRRTATDYTVNATATAFVPYLTLRGEPVSVGQLRAWLVTKPPPPTSKPVFPIVHRDGQWSAFGDDAGFQFWCLVANRARSGNLVMIEHQEPRSELTRPVYFVDMGRGSRVLKLNHETNE